MERSSVLVIEDHPLVADAMLRVVEAVDASISVVSATSAESGLAKAKELRNLRLILMDYGLPGLSGNEAIRIFRQRNSDAKVIVISGSEDRQVILGAIRAGAAAYLSKTVDESVIQDFIRRALAGNLNEPEWVTSAAKSSACQGVQGDLTERQLEVLSLLMRGYSNKEIGLRIGVAEITVKMHLSAIFRSLGVVNRTQAVMAVRRLGLVQINESDSDLSTM